MNIQHPFNIAIVGAMGMGKSYLTKSIIKKYPAKNCFIFDFRREYEKINKRYNIFYDFDVFKKTAFNTKNGIFVFEEATAFLSKHSSDLEIIKLLTGVRHNNTSTILLFHSLRSLPVDIVDYIDYLFIFGTNDRAELIRNKYKDTFPTSIINQIPTLPKRKFITITQTRR